MPEYHGKHLQAPAIQLFRFNLLPVGGTPTSFNCPFCPDGSLHGHRDRAGGTSKMDRCSDCGQLVEYMDREFEDQHVCPRCKESTLTRVEGSWRCMNCGSEYDTD